MAHVVSGKIFKAPFVKTGCGPQQDSTMYAVELSEVIKDFRDPNVKHYTNYKALFFAKTPAANDYYSKAFAEGSFVVVACEKLKVEVSDCGKFVKLNMDNPRLEGAAFNDNQPARQQSQQQQWGQPSQPTPQNNPAPVNNNQPDFDNQDIPF